MKEAAVARQPEGKIGVSASEEITAIWSSKYICIFRVPLETRPIVPSRNNKKKFKQSNISFGVYVYTGGYLENACPVT